MEFRVSGLSPGVELKGAGFETADSSTLPLDKDNHGDLKFRASEETGWFYILHCFGVLNFRVFEANGLEFSVEGCAQAAIWLAATDDRAAKQSEDECAVHEIHTAPATV